MREGGEAVNSPSVKEGEKDERIAAKGHDTQVHCAAFSSSFSTSSSPSLLDHRSRTGAFPTLSKQKPIENVTFAVPIEESKCDAYLDI